MWAKTFIVRLVAVLTAIVCCSIANALISCCFTRNILRSRLRYVEREIINNLFQEGESVAFKPTSPQNQALFGMLQEFEYRCCSERTRFQGFVLLI